jgi:hypothetical protein
MQVHRYNFSCSSTFSGTRKEKRKKSYLESNKTNTSKEEYFSSWMSISEMVLPGQEFSPSSNSIKY